MRIGQSFGVLGCSLLVWEALAAFPSRPTNLDFAQGAAGWKLGSASWTISATGGRGGSSCLAWKRVASTDEQFTTSKHFALEGGGKYRFGGWVKPEKLVRTDCPEKPIKVRLTFDWYDANGKWIQGTDAVPVDENGVGHEGWVRYEGETAPMPGTAVSGQIRLNPAPAFSSGTFKVDDLMFEPAGVCAVEWMVSSVYRDQAETGMVRFHAILHVNTVKTPLETLQPTFIFTDATGRRIERTATTFDAESAGLALNVAELAKGTHPVTFELRAKTGPALGSFALAFTHGPRPKRRVDIDAQGRTLVDGKCFFPMGMYMGLSPMALDMITNSPFNCIMAYQIPNAVQLDAIAAAGRMICFNVQKNVKLDLAKTVQSIRRHPAILAWYDNDESPVSAVPELRALRTRLHELDPDHPVWGVTDKPHLVRPFLGTCDVIGMDPYPIGNRQGNINTASAWPLKVREASFETLPQWQVPQTFNWKWYRPKEANPEHRFPTRAELFCMTYQAIAAGANGLFDFTLSPGTKDERAREFAANWPNVCAVAADVRAHAELILSDPGPVVEAKPAQAVVRTWHTDVGEIVALVCNTTREAVRGELRVTGCAAQAIDLAPLAHQFLLLASPNGLQMQVKSDSPGGNTRASCALPAGGGVAHVEPKVTDEILTNPGMGMFHFFYSGRLWAYGAEQEPGDVLDSMPGMSLAYLRLPWSFIEPEEGVFRWDLLDGRMQPWIQAGKKIGIRISIMNISIDSTPQWVRDAGAKGHDYYYKPDSAPCWEPVWDDPVLLAKLEHFYTAFAARYDGNPDVAFVDVGSFGLFGEGHSKTLAKLRADNPNEFFRLTKLHIDLIRKALPKTYLVISDDVGGGGWLRGKDGKPLTDHPIFAYCRSLGIGLRDDSIMCNPQHPWASDAFGRTFAESTPVILETGQITRRLEKNAWFPEKLLPCVEAYHASYLGVHGFPDLVWEKNQHVWRAVANRLGYRFILKSVDFPRTVHTDERVTISSTWLNAGVAPCYRGGAVTWNILNEKGVVCWCSTDETFDFRALAPTWNGVENPVTLASSCTFGCTADVPDNGNDMILNWCRKNHRNDPGTRVMLLKPGTYTLAVSIGRRNGTPEIALPLVGGVNRRYPIGAIQILDRK